MSKYQKFMFDNFEVACEEKKSVAIDSSLMPETPEAEFVETLERPAETVVAEPIEVPFVASYSQDELDAAVKTAEERGYEKGFKSATESSEQHQQELLENINNRLLTMLSEASVSAELNEKNSLRFAVELVRKLLPGLEREQAAEAVSRFLGENFPNFRREPQLSFSFNPATAPQMPEIISKLAAKNDFEGKIAVHKDEALGPADCRVEWKNGGVEKKTDKMLEKVADLLDDKANTNEERKHG